jgi:hypothetical protein
MGLTANVRYPSRWREEKVKRGFFFFLKKKKIPPPWRRCEIGGYVRGGAQNILQGR